MFLRCIVYVPTFVPYHAVSVADERETTVFMVGSQKPQLPCPKCHKWYQPKVVISHEIVVRVKRLGIVKIVEIRNKVRMVKKVRLIDETE
jgi:hypothetical protein